MLELVSTDDARAHLRLDDTEDDSWLSVFIPAISSAVAMWLKEEWRLYVPEVDPEGHVITDSNGDPIPSSDSNGYVV
jgi:hypothetical protein